MGRSQSWGSRGQRSAEEEEVGKAQREESWLRSIQFVVVTVNMSCASIVNRIAQNPNIEIKNWSWTHFGFKKPLKYSKQVLTLHEVVFQTNPFGRISQRCRGNTFFFFGRYTLADVANGVT